MHVFGVWKYGNHPHRIHLQVGFCFLQHGLGGFDLDEFSRRSDSKGVYGAYKTSCLSLWMIEPWDVSNDKVVDQLKKHTLMFFKIRGQWGTRCKTKNTTTPCEHRFFVPYFRDLVIRFLVICLGTDENHLYNQISWFDDLYNLFIPIVIYVLLMIVLSNHLELCVNLQINFWFELFGSLLVCAHTLSIAWSVLNLGSLVIANFESMLHNFEQSSLLLYYRLRFY